MLHSNFINFKEYLGRKIFFNITINWRKPHIIVYIYFNTDLKLNQQTIIFI